MVSAPPPYVSAAVAGARMTEFRCRECRALLIVYHHATGSETWVRCIRCRVWYSLIVN